MRKISTKFQERLIALGMVMMLCIILVPLLIMGKYNFPCGDDYAFAITAGHTYSESIGLFQNILLQLSNTYHEYLSWQGTYSQNYIALLVNALCLDEYYYLVPIMTLLPLSASILYLIHVLLYKIFDASHAQCIIVGIPILSLIILYTPCPSEAYYWMNSATLYTSSYCFAILSIALYISLMFSNSTQHFLQGIKRTILVFLAILLGGSSYPSALPAMGIMFFLVILCWFQRNHERIFLSVHLALTFLALLISICSPGAAVRQSQVGEPLSPLQAIFRSFVEAYNYMEQWSILPVMLLVSSLIPLFYKIMQKKAFRFPFPIAFSLLSFCIYAMHFTPCLYALGIIGAYRVINLYRYSLYILLVVNCFYWTGFVHRKWGKKLHLPIFLNKLALRSILYTGVAFIVVVPLLYYYGGDTITTVSAIKSLRYGNAQRYYAQFEERLEILTAEENQDIVFEPLDPDVPYLLYLQDLGTDPTAWRNSVTAKYYHQKSVRIRE